MSARRTERLLNLVICLLATRRWLTKEQIRGLVPQYAECDTAEAFDRMFERDKEDLRELGVPVVTGTDSAWFDDETGYRIDRDAYALPPVELDAEELAVLGLASRVWQQASLAGPAARALAKLTALGVEPDETGLIGVEPRVRTAEPAFEPLYAATRTRTPVRFTYRKPNGEVAERRVEPWAVVSRGGRWYLAALDRDRGEARVFRLSRIESDIRSIGRAGSYTVPEGMDPRDLVAPMQGTLDERKALVRVRPGRGGSLRRRALEVSAASVDGWDELTVAVNDVGMLGDELAGYGPDVVVLEPADLRAGVVRRLRAAQAMQGGTVQLPAGEPVRGGHLVSGAATTRLSRLLAMVPWLLRRQGISLEEAARHFDISEEQLVKDLELLFVCGTPGHMPDDLIEAEWESGQVYVDNADEISRPLRLAPDEAVALLVGLRTLAEVPGLHDRGPVESALAKLSAAAGDALPSSAPPLTVDLSAGAEEEILRAGREALRKRRRLRLHYLVPSRDETTVRDVDPMRVTNTAGHWYLEGWCHRAEDVRLFRVDRVSRIELLDVDGTPPAGATSRDADEQLFVPTGDEPLVTLEVERRGRWVAEYYRAEETEELPDGRLRVRLRAADPRWLPRLVLRLGGAGRIVDPPELAAQAEALAGQALAAYT